MAPATQQPILITDLVAQLVEGRTSEVTKRGHWRILEYELEQIGPGRGLANRDRGEGELRIRLGATGRHRISFIARYSPVRAKLTGDLCFDTCDPVSEGVEKEGWFDAEEVLWREADLTGRDLIIDDRARHCILAIRLTPCEAKAEDCEVRWPMAFTNDGGTMCERAFRSPDDLFEWNEHVPADGCVRVMIFGGTHGDNCQHFTDVGTETGQLEEAGGAWQDHSERIAANMKQFREWNINPAEAMIEYAHKRGWEIHFYIRHRGWGGAWPCDGSDESRFCRAHPEYRNVGPQGEQVMGMSVAYPEVREHLAKLYAEIAGYGADGVSPCFIRGCPIVLYEPAMTEGFKARHGADPRDLAAADPRWLDYSSEVVTGWMRRMKDAIGPNCRLSPMIHSSPALNRRFAMDIATWVAEGIVDDLFIMIHQYDQWGNHSQGGPECMEFEYFQTLPGRENVRLWPMFYPWQWWTANAKLYGTALQGYLDQGADGYGMWDLAAQSRDKAANIWDLGKWPRPSYRPAPSRLMAKYEITRWCGYLYNRYSPIEGW